MNLAIVRVLDSAGRMSLEFGDSLDAAEVPMLFVGVGFWMLEFRAFLTAPSSAENKMEPRHLGCYKIEP